MMSIIALTCVYSCPTECLFFYIYIYTCIYVSLHIYILSARLTIRNWLYHGHVLHDNTSNCPIHFVTYKVKRTITCILNCYWIHTESILNAAYTKIGYVFWCYKLLYVNTINMINNLYWLIITKCYASYNTELELLAKRYDSTIMYVARCM